MNIDLPRIPEHIHKWVNTPDGHCQVFLEGEEILEEPYTYDGKGRCVLRWRVEGDKRIIKLRLYKNTREYVEMINARVAHGTITVTIDRTKLAKYFEGPRL